MSIISRIITWIKSNLLATVKANTDPIKVLDLKIENMKKQFAEVEKAHTEYRANAEYYNKKLKGVEIIVGDLNKAIESEKAKGDDVNIEAVRTLVTKLIKYEEELNSYKEIIDTQFTPNIEKSGRIVEAVREKIEELMSKRNALKVRHESSKAITNLKKAIDDVDGGALSDRAEIEDTVLMEESRADVALKDLNMDDEKLSADNFLKNSKIDNRMNEILGKEEKSKSKSKK